jgi:uncharacterized protein (TIGR02145 family)
MKKLLMSLAIILITVSAFTQFSPPINPVAIWKFNGSLNDEAGIYNLTSSGSTYETGKIGTAFKFTGSEECYNTDVNLRRVFDSNNSWSVNLWFNSSIPYDTYTPGMGDTQKALFYCDGENVQPFKRTTITADQRGILFSRMLGSGNGGNITAAYSFVQDTWYHLSLNFNGSDATVYINGSLVNITLSGDLGQDIGDEDANTTQITIGGNRQDNVVQWNGLIDQVYLYNRVLTPFEVQQLYHEAELLAGEVITDIDGNFYNTVTIGSQVWMAENLKTTRFNDNTGITNYNSFPMPNMRYPAYCWYNNDPISYKGTYGALYNWFTINTGILCPTGWHVPTDAEWATLTDFLGGRSIAGGKLKETGTTLWISPNEGATNESGFTALPGGFKSYNGAFTNVGYSGLWWSSTKLSPQVAWYLGVNNDNNEASRGYQNMNALYSVRCVSGLAPAIVTTEIISITQTSASSGGIVTSDGGSPVTARGVCWNTTPNPTVDLVTKTTDGMGNGSFVSEVTGLLTGTSYYLRAYATNSSGTTYGDEFSFNTYKPDAIIDIVGNYYNTVTIGSQVWMAENLKTTKYNNGIEIPLNSNGQFLLTPAYCWPRYDPTHSTDAHGALYNWYTVTTGNLCLTGWHVPSLSELNTLISYLGGYDIAGGKLKESGIINWLEPNVGATNETGFTALPGDYIGYDVDRNLQHPINYTGIWWTSSESHPNENGARGYRMYNDNSIASISNSGGLNAFYSNSDNLPVRCVQGHTIPSVTTTEITSITKTSAISGGTVTSDGGSIVTARGVCWSTIYRDPYPTVDLPTKSTDGSGTGSFISAITGCLTGPVYYVRAYATNSFGTGYGKELQFSPTACHFIPPWWPLNGMDHMNLYALTATLDGLALQPGDEIGVFDGDVCVGNGVLTAVLTGSNYLECRVSMDDPDTPTKDGYTTGDKISYKIWDDSEGIEVSNIQAAYISGEGIFSPGASASFNLTSIYFINQSINLSTGWNIFSFAIELRNMSLITILNPLIGDETLLKVQDEKGNAIEKLPDPIGWINNIGQMSVTEGYKIKVTGNRIQSFNGHFLTLPLDIPLEAGWNIIGYPVMSSQSAMDAFNPLIIAGSLVKVQNEQGSAIEKLPDPIGWIDNIHNLVPGKGYKVKTSVNTTLTINNSSGKGESQNGETAVIQPTHFKPIYSGNGLDHMNIYLERPTAGGTVLNRGDEIGVFDDGLCVGVGVVDNPDIKYMPVIVSMDDPTTEEVDGFTEGSAFNLRLWDSHTGMEMITQNIEVDKGYDKLFEKLGTSVIKIDFEEVPHSFLGDAYPNPSTGKTTFTFQLIRECKVRLEIFNVIGDLVKVLVAQDMTEGNHEIEWDNQTSSGNKAKAGIYFYKLKMNDFSQTKKLVIH